MPKTLSGVTVHTVPADLKKALTSDRESLTLWEGLTPLARNEWICWVTFVKQEETRKDHVRRVVSQLKEGKRRPCCWIGCIHRTDKKISLYNALAASHINIMPLVNSNGRLSGVLTKKGALRTQFYTPALNAKGEFYTAVAVGVGPDLEKKVLRLLEMGADLIVLDTAHGHQKRMIDGIKLVRSMIGKDAPLCAGNIVTAQAAEDCISAGANILKVGVGPGAMCSTRMMTGVGRPQFSAVLETSRVAKEYGAEVWADGGIKHPRDVALAIAAGAHATYFGSWFAGTYESAADLQTDEQGRLYKENFGMASNRAVTGRTPELHAFENAQKEFFQEGISHSKMYLKPGEESAEDILDRVTFGLRSACTYSGARTLQEFSEKVIVSSQTDAGFQEGKPVYERW